MSLFPASYLPVLDLVNPCFMELQQEIRGTILQPFCHDTRGEILADSPVLLLDKSFKDALTALVQRRK
jgi:hypothetical protein